MARFQKTFCSQCGGTFGPGDSGYSHCIDHRDDAGECDCCGQRAILSRCWAAGGIETFATGPEPHCREYR